MNRAAWSFLVVAACVSEPELEEENVALRPTTCRPWGCGQNTPIGPDGQIFDRMDWSSRTPNDGGVKIVRAKKGSSPVKLRVELDELVATRVSTGEVLRGHDVGNVIIDLESPAGAFQIWIESVQVIRFWAGDTTDESYYYNLQVRRPIGGQWNPACRETNLDDDPRWGAPYMALMFTGDRYDAEAKTVSDDVGSTWFQIACANSWPAKLHLIRHTHAGGHGPGGTLDYPTEPWQRTTYLKALVADYLGDGEVNTEVGITLHYTDAAGLHSYPSPPLSGLPEEAIWNEAGAFCLDTPRYAPRWWFPTPPCTAEQLANWPKYGYVLTGRAP